MNASYGWLRDLLPGLALGPGGVAERLALRGAPVEGMISAGQELTGVVVARVEETAPHPDADRLTLCRVDAGRGVVQVVCGASNVRAGGWYAFAPMGVTLPGGIEIKKTKIRGEASEGMLCSPKELGMGEDHAGILEIEGDFAPGEALDVALGLDDVTLEVEVTSNRGDLLSHVGIARELASEGGVLRLPEVPGDPRVKPEYRQGAPEVSAGGVSVRVDAPDLCRRYLAAVIRGVRIAPSPEWLQVRLRGAGSRPINNVVDATNYVMLELGQPLHAFDLSRLAGSAIVVRRPGAGEKSFVTLDGERRDLGPEMCMICDAEAPVAIGGVMGGLDSEVDEGTTDLLLECALFEPRSINKTRRTLSMSTDASYRFERGVDPAGMRAALERAVAIILATAGGRLDGPVLDCAPVEHEAAVIALRLSRIERVLGVAFEADAVRGLLEPLGFELEAPLEDDVLRVRVPGFRSWDVTREIDLIEEVARTYGYDRFPAELGAYRPGTVPDDPQLQLEDRIRRALVTMGLFETQTPAFAPEEEGDLRVSNPLNAREPVMRRTLLPSLLRRLEHNLAHGNRDVRLFEIGTSFRKAPRGGPPVEETHVAAVLTGRRHPPHWSVPDVALDVWDLKAVLEEAARTAHGEQACVVGAAGRGAAPYESDLHLEVRASDGSTLGAGGRVAPGNVDVPVWAGDVWGLELTIPAGTSIATRPVDYRPLPRFPAVERDLSLLVPEGVEAAAIGATTRDAGGALLEDLHVFDRFEGEGLPAGTRSLAFRLRFRARDRTLKDEEVERTVRSVLRRLEEELGVRQRG